VNKEEEKEKETPSVCNRSHRSSCIFIEATVLNAAVIPATVLNAAVIPAIDFFALRVLIRDPPEKQKQKQKEKQKEKEKETPCSCHPGH
jgi:hypothetical protein